MCQSMHDRLHKAPAEPRRSEDVAFFLKSRLFMLRQWWRDRGSPVMLQSRGSKNSDAPIIAQVRGALWTQASTAEFPLTAGKVQNLRAACVRFHGLEIPAGEIFSFWKQLGRTTRAKGFTFGRELRSGCLVPNIGGGLCQLSGQLHEAALLCGLEVVERHAHSRLLPGVELPPERDATVFWNYVDLRFRGSFPWRLETHLSDTELVVTIRGMAMVNPNRPPQPGHDTHLPVRASADGDCHTCGALSCFRHPVANRGHKAAGHTAFLLEAHWPEFQTWCKRHTQAEDCWFTPLNGHRWKKPNYAWSPPSGIALYHATRQTLRRSWRQRRVPLQGAARQAFLLHAQEELAADLARHVVPEARHFVVSQSLLPHLWRAGHLGGRTFDVLLHRWPLADLESRLNQAAARHPQSPTLADFRADSDLVLAESQALAAAARIITPHVALASAFGLRAILLEWEVANLEARTDPVLTSPRWFFPASAVARKGVYELADALQHTGGELLVLGHATEGHNDPLKNIPHRLATMADLPHCTAIVLPAWIEHEPRLALRALALGIPVIATHACGFAPHRLLTMLDAGDSKSLREAMQKCAQGLG